MSLHGYIPKWKKALWVKTKPAAKKVYVLKRSTIRRPALKRRTSKIAPVSAAKREQLIEYAKTKRAWWLTVAGTYCPVMLAIFGRHVLVERNPHHMRGRLGSLLCDTRFWLAVSEEGHRWIHDHIAEARQHGWMCQPGEWNVQP